MNGKSRDINIAIAGGGIAGLALAAGLHQNHKHIRFHVYEATAEYKDIGAGLAIHMNGIKAMELIDPRLRQAYFDKGLLMGEEHLEMSTDVVVAAGCYKDELVAQLGKAKGRKTVSRADLLEGFAESIPNSCITFGKRLESIYQDESGVRLTFQDGTTAQADCLIAADGVHSVARRYILGEDHPASKPVNHENWHIYRRNLSAEEARRKNFPEKWMKGIPILLGPGAYINTMPLSKGMRLSLSVCVRGVRFDEKDHPPSLDLDHFKTYSDDAMQMARIVAEEQESWTPVDHDHASAYFRGRVAMIGDAAHATMAFNGQGAAQALEDVAVLNHLLSRLSYPLQVEDVFSAYDTIRRPRSQKVVDLSRQFGRIYVFADGDLNRDPENMRKVMGAGGAYTNAFDLAQQNEDAMQAYERRLAHQSN